MYYFLLSIQVLLAIAIIVLVLLQPHEGEGMGAVFGGSSSVETFLGTKTITVLWKATVVLGCLFIALAIVLNMISQESSTGEGGALGNSQQTEEQTNQNGTKGTKQGGPSGDTVPAGGSSNGGGSNTQ